jgi:predicted nucleotidyltransferase
MLNYLDIFKEFNNKKIKYIVVGGVALNFYGIPRMTYDIDLLIALEDENLRRFLSLMKKWGFRPKVPVNIMDFAIENKRKGWIKNKNMKAFNLVNPKWPISEMDIIIDTPVNYEKASKNFKIFRLQGISIPVISMIDLIKMKQTANRIQDKQDIKNLKKILNEK